MSRIHARAVRPWHLVAGLSAAALVFATAAPLAGADQGASTQANVVSGTTPPEIECSWAMPDMNSSAPGVQYVNGANASDDNSVAVPSPASSCAIQPNLPWPVQPDQVRHQIQVRPNELNQPEPRRIELWSAVSADTGLGSISSVYWKVFHPDGTFKAQIHAETLTNGQPQDYAHGVYAAPGAPLASSMPQIGDCYGPGGVSPNVGTMFKGAANGVVSGKGTYELSSGAIDPTNQKSLITACNEVQKGFFFAGFDLHKEQPCGEYVVEAHALVNGAEAPVLRYSIDVECVFFLETDFTTVNWGTLIPGSQKTLPGNTTFDPADGMPTVRNGGNAGMEVGLRYAPLVQSDQAGTPVPGAKLITWFDGRLGRNANHLQSITQIDSGVTPGVLGAASYFDSEPNSPGKPGGEHWYQIVCSDETAKLDLSVHPAANIPSGNYVGAMAVVAKRHAGDGMGNGQVWQPGNALWDRQDVATANNKFLNTKLCWQDQDQIIPWN